MNTKILFLPVLLMAPLALIAQNKDTRPFEKFICDENYFTAMIPSDWEKQEEIILGRQEKQYGVDLTDLKAKSSAFSSISLIYFGPDHPRFKTPEKYIRVSLETRKKIKGETVTTPKDSVLNGRKVKFFEKLNYISVPPGAAVPKKVLMYEKYVIMPAKKGFFVLSLQSPKDGAKAYLNIFDKITASFKPNI